MVKLHPGIDRATLIVLVPAASVMAGDEIRLRQELYLLGRSRACHVVIADKFISRLHARIEQVDSQYILYDAESANGTFVNEALLSRPHVLRDGDRIGLGRPLPVLRFMLSPDELGTQ